MNLKNTINAATRQVTHNTTTPCTTTTTTTSSVNDDRVWRTAGDIRLTQPP
jgi:hypothetical protein